MGVLLSSAGDDYQKSVVLAVLVGTVMLVISAWMMLALVSYLFKSMGLHRIARRVKFEDAWRAWVPYFSRYIFADMIERDLVFGKTKVRHFPLYYMLLHFGAAFLMLISFIFAFIPIVGWIVTGLLLFAIITLTSVVEGYTMYRFFKKYWCDKALLYTIIAVAVPLSLSYILFYAKNKPFVSDDVSENTEEETD